MTKLTEHSEMMRFLGARFYFLMIHYIKNINIFKQNIPIHNYVSIFNMYQFVSSLGVGGAMRCVLCVSHLALQQHGIVLDTWEFRNYFILNYVRYLNSICAPHKEAHFIAAKCTRLPHSIQHNLIIADPTHPHAHSLSSCYGHYTKYVCDIPTQMHTNHAHRKCPLFTRKPPSPCAACTRARRDKTGAHKIGDTCLHCAFQPANGIVITVNCVYICLCVCIKKH